MQRELKLQNYSGTVTITDISVYHSEITFDLGNCKVTAKLSETDLDGLSKMLCVARGDLLSNQHRFSKTNDKFTPEEIGLLQTGNAIQVIKMVRERTGMFLKDAKDYVDNHKHRYWKPKD